MHRNRQGIQSVADEMSVETQMKCWAGWAVWSMMPPANLVVGMAGARSRT
jgi:hypothetical protein